MDDYFLDYGRFGELSYNNRNGKWSSKRYSRTTVPVRSLGPVETYVSAALPTSSRKSNGSASRSKDVHNLTQNRPEFQAGVDVIFDYLSEALLDQPPVDQFSSDLLGFGRAQYADRSATTSSGSRRKRLWPVAAIPTGSHRDKVCILELRQCTQGWSENPTGKRTAGLDGFDLKDTAKGVWHGDGGLIRQICFAPNDDDSHTLLAVRTSMSVHLLRPLFASGFAGLKPMATLQTPSQAEADYVDMAFNPWNSKQLATVDSHGCYMVWDITETWKYCHKTVTSSSQMRHSKLYNDGDSMDLPDDGWHRILWIFDDKTLVLCSRSHLECLDLSGRFLGEANSFDEQNGQLSWILDLKKSPSQDDELFVLTTLSWIWLRIRASDDGVFFETVLSWKHHRDFNDLSLRLSFLEDPRDLRVMLYSRGGNLVTEYRLANPVHSSSHTLQGAPTRWDWRGSSLQDIKFMNLPVHRSVDRSATHWSDNVKFWHVVALASDLSLSGCWFHDRADMCEKIEPPSWKSNKEQRWGQLAKDKSDFLIDDGKDENYDSGIDAPGFVIRHKSRADSEELPLPVLDTASSIPNEIVSDAIHKMVNEDASEMVDALRSITNLLSNVAVRNAMKLQTLATTLPKPLKVTDLDETFKTASKLVNQFQGNSVANNSRLIFAPLASPLTLGLSEFESSENFPPMNLFFQRLLSIYSRHLAVTVRGKPRLSKEKVVRQVAGSIFLASIGIRRQSSLEGTDHSTSSLNATQESAQSLGVAASSMPILGVSTLDPFAESADRLSNYTQIASQSKGSTVYPKTVNDSMSQILGHWTLRADPIQYSYQDATAALTGQSSIQGSQMSAALREDIKKREQRAKEVAEMRMAREKRKQEQGGDAKRRKLDPRAVESQPDAINRMGHGKTFEIVDSRSQPQIGAPSQYGRPSTLDVIPTTRPSQTQTSQRTQQPSSFSSQVGPKSSNRPAKRKGF